MIRAICSAISVKYNHHAIEQKWQEQWASSHAFEARDGDARPKEYLLVEFPYPSGDGLHVGHIRPYVALDIIARKRRMEGRNVLYPFGWDAFGLPTENYAIKMGIHPRVATERNVATFKRQIQSLGISFDWSREVNTTDPAYYKWTQWIFLQLLKHGLAYKARIPINWCPSCKIGLANEEATGGTCERCGGSVEKRDREQWMLKITAYAEKLLAGLETVDYIERAKVQQVNWIGKSEGALLKFQIPSAKSQTNSKSQAPKLEIEVFTTRPDTLFGATYLVLAPEHPLVERLLSSSSPQPSPLVIPSGERGISQDGEEVPILENPDEVRAYIEQARRKTEIERTTEEKEKTGVELKGIKAINPANGEEIPVWVADFVLGHYGTGAVFADAHDERDFVFAKKYGIRLRATLRPPNGTDDSRIRTLEECFSGKGILYDSAEFSGLTSDEAIPRIGAKFGKMTVTYKLRDWVFSRQRYWGEPIPVVFCAGCGGPHPPAPPLPEGRGEIKKDFSPSHREGELEGVGDVHASRLTPHASVTIDGVSHAIVPVPEDQLPVELPNVERYQPTDTGDSPLAAITEWVNTTCPKCGGPAKRETDVMPNWAGSSWYFLAYLMRGVENQKQHSNILENVGMLSSLPFPIARYREAFAYWMPVDWYNGGMEHTTLHLLYSRFWNLFLHDIGVVPVAEPYAKRTSHGLVLAADGEKMSKSRGNVVNPDEIVERFGADAVRLYEMFIGPFDQQVPWSTDGLVGCRRFLEKVVTLAERVDTKQQGSRAAGQQGIGNAELVRFLHRTIKKVTEDIEAMRFNTAVSCLMEFANVLGKQEVVPDAVFGTFLRLLAPFAPHVCEELFVQLQAPSPSSSPSREGEKVGVGSVSQEPWPSYDPALVVEDEIDLVVQVNGKVRATIRVPVDIAEADARTCALAEPNVAKYVGVQEPKKIVFVPGRLLNVVV